VLLLEFFAASRRMMARHLEDAGWRVIEAATAGEAVSRLDLAERNGPAFDAWIVPALCVEWAAAEMTARAGSNSISHHAHLVCVHFPGEIGSIPTTPRIRHVARPALKPSQLLDAMNFRACKLRALVADDNEINQRVLVEMLRRIGWESETAPNGIAAVHRARSRTFDAVFMDLHMPEMDGFDAARAIVEHHRGANFSSAPVIIGVSSDSRPESRQLCYEAGMAAFLAKPFKRADLEQVIGQVISPLSCLVEAP
jgi:CheY-like chemotaxis protein